MNCRIKQKPVIKYLSLSVLIIGYLSIETLPFEFIAHKECVYYKTTICPRFGEN